MRTRKLPGPPAIWTAFAQQGRWKNWVLVGQLGAILFLTAVCLSLASRPPDIVVVGEDGNGTYVASEVSSRALQDFLRTQRGRPADITIRAFSQRFIRLTAEVNSTTIDDAWAEATSLMIAPLAQQMRAEADAQRLLETYRIAAVRTRLDFDALEVIERRDSKTHVRARLSRHREKLVGGGGSDDTMQVDLVLVEVPRSREHPDGLVVLDWRSGPISTSQVTP
ncbi:MAG: hypothetical protein QM817_40705 [Archangium sp.]